MQAVNLVNTGSKDLQTVSAYVAQAVNEARTATELSPRSVAIWENLAIMYENAAVIVPEAREWAIKSWQKAKELEPTNPVLAWRLANNYALSNNMDEAVKNYKEASTLKGDYLDSYVGLARVYEQQNKIDEAVDAYKSAMSNGGTNNPVLLFDFGRLLYNRNKDKDRNDSEVLWLAAVKLQPNYSNALYSLGLLYESRGDKTSALQYYYKVKDLNPDNKDIITKIRSMVGGGSAPAPTTDDTTTNQ
jgi:tetratricopeptide (TPR) repeat protein